MPHVPPPAGARRPAAAGAPDPIGAEDRELLARVADRVVDLRLEVPALLTLETAAPLSFAAGQAMLFFEPFVTALLRLGDYRRFARLVERREAVRILIGEIESRAEAAHRRRRDEARARRDAARAAGRRP